MYTLVYHRYVHIYMFKCVHIYIYIYTYIHIYRYIRISLIEIYTVGFVTIPCHYIFVHIYLSKHFDIYTFKCVCIYTCSPMCIGEIIFISMARTYCALATHPCLFCWVCGDTHVCSAGCFATQFCWREQNATQHNSPHRDTQRHVFCWVASAQYVLATQHNSPHRDTQQNRHGRVARHPAEQTSVLLGVLPRTQQNRHL